METKSTISNLFSPRKVSFKIPVYQRAFSWDVGENNDGQVPQFLKDLIDQPEGVQYYLGHFLFEMDLQHPGRHFVIDGQQRMTTIVIFFACLRNILKIKAPDVIVSEIEEDYLQNSKERVKFRTVDYDQNFFENEIIANISDEANTKSRRRIREAKQYFQEQLEKLEPEKLLYLKNVLENAQITTDEVQFQTEAAQLFNFQNDRGKKLTDLEKLKAFLMFNIFHSAAAKGEDAEDFIRFVQEEFKTIYLELEKIEMLTEDQVLSYHSTCFHSVSGNSLENIKSSYYRSNEKISWIKDFSTKLKQTFLLIPKIEKHAQSSSFVGDVLLLDSYNSWPLIIKLFHCHSDSIETIERFAELMEITLAKMEFTIGRYQTNRFHSYARDYDLKKKENLLNQLLDNADNGFQPYWNFQADFEKWLRGSYHYFSSVKYLLWKYENSIRGTKDHPMLYAEYCNLYHSHNLETTVDHWAPQNPSNQTYSAEFKEKCLNNIGNLVLATRSRNSSDSNAAPENKEKKSVLLSKQEMEEKGEKWGALEILERQEKIVEFALKKWAAKK